MLFSSSRIRVACLAASIVVATSTCGGLDTFELTERSRTIVPAGTLIDQLVGDLGFGDFLALDLTENRELANQGVERHEIDSVMIGAIDLEIAGPEGADFTFLDDIEFYVQAEDLPRVRIARGGPFPQGADSVSLDIDAVELAPYAAASSMDITTEARGRPPRSETTIDAVVTLLVDVNVDGVLCGE